MTRRGLVENLDNIHFYQRTMVCRDVVDNQEMDLNTLYGCLSGTRKHVGTSFSDPSHVAACFDMIYAVAGGEEKWLRAAFRVRTRTAFVVPPMKFAEESCITMEDCIRRGMPMLLLSAGQAGATAPAPIALTIVQAVAECLAGRRLCECDQEGRALRSSAPGPLSVDLRTGAMSGGSRRAGAADRRLRADAPVLRPAGGRGLGHFGFETARHASRLGTGHHQFAGGPCGPEHVL